MSGFLNDNRFFSVYSISRGYPGVRRLEKIPCNQTCSRGPNRGAPPDFWIKVGGELCTKRVLRIGASTTSKVLWWKDCNNFIYALIFEKVKNFSCWDLWKTWWW